MRTLLLLGVLLACGAGCGSKGSSAGDGGVDAPSDALPRVCVPGRAVACTGPSGCAGGQVCVANGTGYGPCDCGYDGAIDDGSAGDALVQDDGGTDDASPDVRIEDGGPNDASDALTDSGGDDVASCQWSRCCAEWNACKADPACWTAMNTTGQCLYNYLCAAFLYCCYYPVPPDGGDCRF